ncbi:MAG: nitroreductase family protein [Pseudomonadales bacterium]|jgi:iodotyrosine deiodinase|nr:nitroreductase family protein [Pseudomonadales bacterium]
MKQPEFVQYDAYVRRSVDDMTARAERFYEQMDTRRTVRDFSHEPVPSSVIEYALRTAGTAPSGANLQPWHFGVVSGPETKREIRKAAEEEEREFYTRRAPQAWLDALAPLGTDANKAFLETAPLLIAVFAQTVGHLADGRKVKHYYPTESTGLATGMLITALHNAGLVCLTHTPSPMRFLNKILGRPKSERPYLLLVVGYPAENAKLPNISRKALSDFVSYRAH